MKIAIIGAGLSGLSTAFHLLYRSQGSLSINLYDSRAIGEGSSGISGGLLHPFPGKEAKRFADADKKINQAHRLIMESSQALNQRVIRSKGILRPATTEDQIANFKKRAQEYPEETEWWNREKCLEKVPALTLSKEEMGSLYIKSGLTVDMPNYLQGLWQAVARLGTTFHQKEIHGNEKELSKIDVIIYALGAEITSIAGLEALPISPVKGQIVTFRWPENLPQPPFSLVGEAYLVMKNEKECFAGATHEHHFQTKEPDLAAALPEIYKKISPFFPPIRELEVIGCRAGVRASNKMTRQPLLGKISKREWFITGLAGKGLLYHGALGDLLAEAILTDDPTLIPKEFSI